MSFIKRALALFGASGEGAKAEPPAASRAEADVVVALFAKQVPELREGLIEVVAASRTPAVRSKIAVRSHDSSLDAVDACVGPRSEHVVAVLRALPPGEVVDVVPWDEDVPRFVLNAVAPIDFLCMEIDDLRREVLLVVSDASLESPSVDRDQNVRLASLLTGYEIVLEAETPFRTRTEPRK